MHCYTQGVLLLACWSTTPERTNDLHLSSGHEQLCVCCIPVDGWQLLEAQRAQSGP